MPRSNFWPEVNWTGVFKASFQSWPRLFWVACGLGFELGFSRWARESAGSEAIAGDWDEFRAGWRGRVFGLEEGPSPRSSRSSTWWDWERVRLKRDCGKGATAAILEAVRSTRSVNAHGGQRGGWRRLRYFWRLSSSSCSAEGSCERWRKQSRSSGPGNFCTRASPANRPATRPVARASCPGRVHTFRHTACTVHPNTPGSLQGSWNPRPRTTACCSAPSAPNVRRLRCAPTPRSASRLTGKFAMFDTQATCYRIATPAALDIKLTLAQDSGRLLMTQGGLAAMMIK